MITVTAANSPRSAITYVFTPRLVSSRGWTSSGRTTISPPPPSSARIASAAATEGENLMPYFLDAARARASEGEMVATLQEIFGKYTEQPVF